MATAKELTRALKGLSIPSLETISKLKDKMYDAAVKEGFNDSIATEFVYKKAIELAKKLKRVKNPSDSSNEASELARGFHGRDNQETYNEIVEERYRTDLAFLGELVQLDILNSKSGKLVQLCFSREDQEETVRIGCSPDRKQLYLVGGNTELDEDMLEEFGVTKDKACLGFVIGIDYFADKHHLTGPKQQKYGIEYTHQFGEQSYKRNDVEKRIQLGLLPELIYDRLNGTFELVGGKYEIRDEGIRD